MVKKLNFLWLDYSQDDFPLGYMHVRFFSLIIGLCVSNEHG